ncbi:MAG: hypothetical protein PHG66_00730 [Candidatus Colwellbacteria bacterium]|nr:hypothetical protein [Candidatus Colwellbacteria bacterium]
MSELEYPDCECGSNHGGIPPPKGPFTCKACKETTDDPHRISIDPEVGGLLCVTCDNARFVIEGDSVQRLEWIRLATLEKIEVEPEDLKRVRVHGEEYYPHLQRMSNDVQK